MEYNSSNDELVVREYGRNIHKLILYSKTIDDREQRQAYMEEIIDLMQRMYPQSRNPEDSRLKLWHHAFKIADFDLGVVPPDGIVPTPEDLRFRPERLAYPVSEARYRYYGYNVSMMIKRALQMETNEVRDGYVQTIAAYMKMSYRTWNKEASSVDEIVRRDLSVMSNGALKLPEGIEIEQEPNNNFQQSPNFNRKPQGGGNNNNQQQKRHHQGNNNNGGGKQQFNKKKRFTKKSN